MSTTSRRQFWKHGPKLNITKFGPTFGEGEDTLEWPPLGCHIILLSKGVHVWMYPISNFWKSFTIFSHIMLEYNLSKH